MVFNRPVLRLCFVCLGNICRSPTAEGVMLKLIDGEGLRDHVVVDSAGTAAYHAGERADPRSRAAAKRRDIDLPSIARQFRAIDFDDFDYVLAMDADNYENLREVAPSDGALEKLVMFRSFDPHSEPDAGVPDPYYGGDGGFDVVLDICEAACLGLLDHLRKQHGVPE